GCACDDRPEEVLRLAVSKRREVESAVFPFDAGRKSRRSRRARGRLHRLDSTAALRTRDEPVCPRVGRGAVQTLAIEFDRIGRIQTAVLFAIDHDWNLLPINVHLQQPWVSSHIKTGGNEI